MDIYTATEEAYKKGFIEGYHSGRKESEHTSLWGFGNVEDRPCVKCGFRGRVSKFCPNCGAAMLNFSAETWV